MSHLNRFGRFPGRNNSILRARFPKKRKSTGASYRRSLRVEPLEDRRLLSITVNTLVDELDGSIVDGDVSLRDALLAATPFETINFAPALTAGGPATTKLKLGELRITKSVIIDGPGADLLTIDASGNDLNPQNDVGDGSRVFNINDGSSFTNIDVRISGLNLTGGDVLLDGGGIRSFENVTLVDVHVDSNASQRDGGGIFSSGSLTLVNSAITGNRAARTGGGIIGTGQYLTLQSSAVKYNAATSGGGLAATPKQTT